MSGHVAPMLLVVHSIVGPVMMMLLHVPIDEHVWSQVSVLCTATQVVHAKTSNESIELVTASASRQDCGGGELLVFEQSHP